MSNITILRPGSCFWRLVAAELIFLLNCWASVLILETHPFSWYPNMVRAAGRQPSGGSEVTPSFLPPKPYKVCVSYRALHRHWDSDENIETTHKSTVPWQSLWMNRQGMSHIDQQYRFCLGMDWRSNSEESHCSPHSKYIAHPWWLMPICYQQPSLAYLGIPWSTPVAGSMEWHAAEPGWLLEMIKLYNTKGLIMSDIRENYLRSRQLPFHRNQMLQMQSWIQ